MIRVILYLAIVAALAFGAVWLADRPGQVMITWQGERIETSVMVLVITVVAVAFLAVVLWGIARAILRSPAALSQHVRRRRQARGLSAISQGLVAVGSGDLRGARRFAAEARRFAPQEPLTFLLGAQAAQLAGDRPQAAQIFEQMAQHEETRLLGLRGLFIEAQRRNDPRAALIYAEQASNHGSARPGAVPAWAGQAVLEFRSTAGDWAGALERLERNLAAGLLDKDAYRRQRAVLLTAQALAAEDGDRSRARALALEAVRLAPTLIPAAALAGRLLGEASEPRKAARIIEAAWTVNPHPDLAEAYAHLRPGASARERLARIETLAAKSPGNPEAALAVARAALDAREFAIAREALAPLASAPTRRVAALMAELERQQGDEGRAREWIARALSARRDPAWTADGYVCDHWLPVSPVTGRLDAFEWKDPLTGEQPRALVDVERHEAAAQSTDHQEPPRLDGPPRLRLAGSSPAGTTAEGAGASPLDPSIASRSRAGRAADDTAADHGESLATVPIAPTVIPLVHAPDDPGPDQDQPRDPTTESEAESASGGWGRIKQLFRAQRSPRARSAE